MFISIVDFVFFLEIFVVFLLLIFIVSGNSFCGSTSSGDLIPGSGSHLRIPAGIPVKFLRRKFLCPIGLSYRTLPLILIKGNDVKPKIPGSFWPP